MVDTLIAPEFSQSNCLITILEGCPICLISARSPILPLLHYYDNEYKNMNMNDRQRIAYCLCVSNIRQRACVCVCVCVVCVCVCRITAQGANGGSGVRSIRSSNGAYVHARFNLTKGQMIYMIIGQQGESACMQVNIRPTLISIVLYRNVHYFV